MISGKKPYGYQLVNLYDMEHRVIEQQVAKEGGKLSIDARFFEYGGKDLWSWRKIYDSLGRVTFYQLYKDQAQVYLDGLSSSLKEEKERGVVTDN